MLALCSVPGPELGSGDMATPEMLALSWRSAWSRGRRLQEPRSQPVELVKGCGGVFAVLENRAGTVHIWWGRGVIEVSREEAIFEFQWGREKARS